MHYYPFNPGDYLRDTAHLGTQEDLAYRRALDRYYVTEKPLPADIGECCKVLRLPPAHKKLLGHVLREFFYLSDSGWRNKRADSEIAKYARLALVSRENGAKGGRKPKTQRVPLANPTETQRVPTANPAETQAVVNKNQNQEPDAFVPKASSVFVPKTAADAAPSLDPVRDAAWAEGVPALMAQGKSEASARSYVGRAIRDYGAPEVLRLLRECDERRIGDISAYVEACGQRIASTTAAQATRDAAWARKKGYANVWEANNDGVTK